MSIQQLLHGIAKHEGRVTKSMVSQQTKCHNHPSPHQLKSAVQGGCWSDVSSIDVNVFIKPHVSAVLWSLQAQLKIRQFFRSKNTAESKGPKAPALRPCRFAGFSSIPLPVPFVCCTRKFAKWRSSQISHPFCLVPFVPFWAQRPATSHLNGNEENQAIRICSPGPTGSQF